MGARTDAEELNHEGHFDQLGGLPVDGSRTPLPKVREDGSPVVDRNGSARFVVSIFVKQLPVPGQRTPKGEEVRVTLATDPGDIAEGEWVELIDPRVNPWEIRDETTGRVSSGLAFSALGVKVSSSGGSVEK